MTEKIRVDTNELTLGELAELEETMGASLQSVMENSQARGMAAIVWLIRRREDPAFTLADALNIRMGDLDMVTPGEALAVSNGGKPQSLPATGP
jgi:hypothetical protein